MYAPTAGSRSAAMKPNRETQPSSTVVDHGDDALRPSARVKPPSRFVPRMRLGAWSQVPLS
jgi:hypothetical protein